MGAGCGLDCAGCIRSAGNRLSELFAPPTKYLPSSPGPAQRRCQRLSATSERSDHAHCPPGRSPPSIVEQLPLALQVTRFHHSPRSCGPPADTQHGWHAGECYTFGCRVTYHCAEGFELVGRPDRFCQADGTWSPRELPACVLITLIVCPPPDNPGNGKAIYTSCSYNSVVTYECKDGYTLVGEPTRRCGADKKWTGEQPECKEINCGHPGILYNGWLENIEAGTGLGASIIFRCHDGMKLEGNTSTVCQIDGRWRYPLPKCLAPCVVPSVRQGRIQLWVGNETTDELPLVVQHGERLFVKCDPMYEFPANRTPICNNGTWTVMPRCGPARCKRMPRAPRNGLVIAPKTEHGMLARFKCRDGFTLRGGNVTECRYGNWTGELPYCQEVYCPFPGYIENGRVMLVGNMGVYDYRPYVRKVTNNKQIIYECERGYVLGDGPPGATCIGGRWSPKELPRCIKGLHPRLRWSRSVQEQRQAVFLSPKFAERIRQFERDLLVKSSRASYLGKKHAIEIASVQHSSLPSSTMINVSTEVDLQQPQIPQGKIFGGQHKPVVIHEARQRKSFHPEVRYQKTSFRFNSPVYKDPDNDAIGWIIHHKGHNIQQNKKSEKYLTDSQNIMDDYSAAGRSGLKSVAEYSETLKRADKEHTLRRLKRALLKGHQSKQGLQLMTKNKNTSPRIKKKGRPRTRDRVKGTKAGPCEPLSSEPFVKIEILKNGRDPIHNYSTGTVARVTCDQGYGPTLSNNTAKCARGRWRPGKPDCIALPCHIPKMEHGLFRLAPADGKPGVMLNASADVPHGNAVDFGCIIGYNIKGPNNMQCWHGEWSSSQGPECTPAPCELPMITNGQYLSGYRAGLTIAHGASVNFQCDSDYSKSTAQPVECSLGMLKPRTPACRHLAPNYRYGNMTGKLSEVDLQFKGGSDITKGGDISVVDFPEGYRRGCGPPARVQGSLVYRDGEPIDDSDKSFPDGTEVTFNCIASIMGEKTTWRIVCEDGSWVGRSLNCEGDEAQDGHTEMKNSTCIYRNTEPNLVSFYNDQHITEEVVEFPPGSVLVSRCVDIGKYAMIGSSHRRCIGGEWDGQKPVCFGLNQQNDYALEKPPTILFRHQLGPIAQSNDGRLIVYPGTILHMECLWIRRFGTPKWVISHNYRKYPEGWTTDPGRDSQLEYRLSIYHASRDDSGVFTCVTPTRHTHAVEIVVKAVHCPPIPSRRGLNVNTLNTKMNTKILLSCANGNSLIGAPEITCLPSGNWSAPIPICESIECADLVNLTDPHLRVSILSREVGGRAVFSCAQGYGLRGPHEAVCLPSGDWTTPMPTCQEVQCDTPPTPENGYIQGSGPYKAGDVVQFNCNPEFMMEGQPIIACQENGRWSGSVPKCVQACSYPGTTISGRMSAVKFYYKIGETITFTCDADLELRGAPMLRCLRNGKWSNAIPTCVSKTS
ncbi:sushi, von Willebrand factor type A, EGF and pentraxin domain-containing protein 1-like [Schistocerca nitens]|uniref:sushi, von Willebrand factor type A, EGF and pentraxin domain-containing protein 1-like n=1 Tax=Schistocerca nitens TaxID=7011 RepID=UPI002118CBBD|nr:sushi, von Willebrand factor type A, EGF and pentraxin domain-containing protein 1-like [Schistocerca nitens]